MQKIIPRVVREDFFTELIIKITQSRKRFSGACFWLFAVLFVARVFINIFMPDLRLSAGQNLHAIAPYLDH